MHSNTMMIFFIKCIITLIFVFTNFVKCEHEDEEDCECGIVGGNPNQFPWYVSLRITVEVPRKSPRARPDQTTHTTYHTGTLVSSKFILTAANIFQGGRDNPETWAALPAAYILDVEDIGSIDDARWLEINKIFIHFLFGQRLWEADENKYYEVNRYNVVLALF